MNDQIKPASNGMVELPIIKEMADHYKMSAAAFAFTFRAVAMPQPHTEAEFVSCCIVAQTHALNPLTKEIYFMRDKHGNIQAIVGVDGWIKKCNEHPQFDGLEFTDERDASGKIVSMTVSIYRKDRSRPIRVTEFMSECVQVRAKEGPWQSHPNRMLRNRTLCQGARIAFGFAGIMDRDEFDQWQAMKDVTPANECQSLPSLPEIPDIPDVPDISDDQPEQIADVAGFLAKLTEDRSYCESEDDVRELALANEDIIARLPDDAKAKAAEILRIEE